MVCVPSSVEKTDGSAVADFGEPLECNAASVKCALLAASINQASLGPVSSYYQHDSDTGIGVRVVQYTVRNSTGFVYSCIQIHELMFTATIMISENSNFRSKFPKFR